MKLTYLHKHKGSSRIKVIAIITAIVAMLAGLTFIGGFIDYLLNAKVMTYVMFVLAFLLAYAVTKRFIFEYRYIYADDIFTAERMIYDGQKVIFACDKRFIVDVLPYSELQTAYPRISARRLAFAKKQSCTALVYQNEQNKKAILIYVDDAFVCGLKQAISADTETT